MRKEFEKKLARRWPSWFDLADPGLNAMGRGFELRDGWLNILWRLCIDLEPLVMKLERETGERFEVVQVQEKRGTLRFYISHHSDPIDERIAEPKIESSTTCEACGRPGKMRETFGEVRAGCDMHPHGPEEMHQICRRLG